MQTKIKGIGHSKKRGFITLDLFAYCTKGIPGVEIVGPRQFSRFFKEKIIYLSKERNLKFPLKRYVLCIDMEDELVQEKGLDFFYWLELPLFLLFWTLTDHLPIHHLSDCLAMGKVSVNGLVTLGRPPHFILEPLIKNNSEKKSAGLKLISLSNIQEDSSLHFFRVQDLMSNISNLSFKEVVFE